MSDYQATLDALHTLASAYPPSHYTTDIENALRTITSTILEGEMLNQLVEDATSGNHGNEIERADAFNIAGIIQEMECVLLKALFRQFPHQAIRYLNESDARTVPTDIRSYAEDRLLHYNASDDSWTEPLSLQHEFTLIRTATLNRLIDNSTTLVCNAVELLDNGEITDADAPLQECITMLCTFIKNPKCINGEDT